MFQNVAFESLDVRIPELKGNGVEFKAELIHSPVCRMSILEDSAGNAIILHQLHRAAH